MRKGTLYLCFITPVCRWLNSKITAWHRVCLNTKDQTRASSPFLLFPFGLLVQRASEGLSSLHSRAEETWYTFVLIQWKRKSSACVFAGEKARWRTRPMWLMRPRRSQRPDPEWTSWPELWLTRWDTISISAKTRHQNKNQQNFDNILIHCQRQKA